MLTMIRTLLVPGLQTPSHKMCPPKQPAFRQLQVAHEQSTCLQCKLNRLENAMHVYSLARLPCRAAHPNATVAMASQWCASASKNSTLCVALSPGTDSGLVRDRICRRQQAAASHNRAGMSNPYLHYICSDQAYLVHNSSSACRLHALALSFKVQKERLTHHSISAPYLQRAHCPAQPLR